MSKKVLFGITLFSVFSVSPNVLADDFIKSDTNLKYTPITNGVYSFGLGDITYNSLLELGNAIYPRFKEGEGFSFDASSQDSLEKDILTGQPALLADLTKGLSQLTGNSFTLEEAQLVIGILNLAKQNGFNPFQEISFNNFFKAQNAGRLDLREVVGVFKGLSGIIDGIKTLGQENAAVIGELAVSNPNTKALVIQKTILEQQPQTVSTTIQLNQLNKQIIANFLDTPQGIKVRNSPQNQENLKNGLTTIEALQDLFPAKTANIQAAADALSLYLADASKTNVKDLPQAQKPDTSVTNGMLLSTLATNSLLSNRAASVGIPGVASGDELETYGAWVKGTFSSGVQKSFEAQPGYKFSQKGVMVGADTDNDLDGRSLFGVAGSFFTNDTANKTGLSQKDKIDTMTGSIYGLYSVNSELFLNGQMSYGRSTIKKKRSTGDLNNNVATAKTKGTILSGMGKIGYTWSVNKEVQIVPSIGISHTHINVRAYSEKGDGLNRKIGKRTAVRTSGIIGASIRYMTKLETIAVSPEVHANMDYAFKSKNSDTKINFANVIDVSTPSEKIAKVIYNLGTSAKFGGNSLLNITIAYDIGLSKLFISHTGALKLRVNF